MAYNIQSDILPPTNPTPIPTTQPTIICQQQPSSAIAEMVQPPYGRSKRKHCTTTPVRHSMASKFASAANHNRDIKATITSPCSTIISETLTTTDKSQTTNKAAIAYKNISHEIQQLVQEEAIQVLETNDEQLVQLIPLS
jgi:hypothetical protein